MSRDTGHRDKSPSPRKASARGVSCCHHQSDGVTWDVCSILAAQGSFHIGSVQLRGRDAAAHVAQEPFFLLQTELGNLNLLQLCAAHPLFHFTGGHPDSWTLLYPSLSHVLHVLLLTSSLFLTRGDAAKSRACCLA